MLLEPLHPSESAEVHDLCWPLGRPTAAEPLPDRFANQGVARLAALPGGLVEAFDQLIVEVNAEIYR